MWFNKKIIANIPNLITLMNLISGAIGIFLVFENHLLWACYMIYVAAVFDFMDGFFARLLKVTSDIGKSLDSLADVISFGLLPTAIIYNIILMIIKHSHPEFTFQTASPLELCLLASSLLMVAFSALRLANFNVDTRQNYGFIGLPTPANAILISSFPFIINNFGSIGSKLLMNLYVIIPVIVILSFLMVAEIPMLSFKFRTFKFTENIYRYLLIFIALVGIIIWGFMAIPVVFVFYIVFSLVQKPTADIEL
jgi:CDP-diacylglycerol--serine O-phosphatidyltransferase